MAQGMDLPATVAPFILRGVTLAGIDSAMCPMPERIAAWQKLAGLLRADDYEEIGDEIGLEAAIPVAAELLAADPLATASSMITSSRASEG